MVRAGVFQTLIRNKTNMPKAFNRAIKVGGEDHKIGTYYVTVIEYDNNDNVIRAKGTSVPADGDKGFALGCLFIHTDGSAGDEIYINEGTASSADFNVYRGNFPGNTAVTATSDGTGTGAIAVGTRFVTVTSSGATQQVALPAISSATVGQQIDIYVGSNGYELITPASSNNTINTVDSDGTNQLDVAANTLLRCVQVSATGWIAYQIAATTITVVAPDND